MNPLERLLNSRRIFAAIAIVATFYLIGGVFAIYYQSSAKASYDGGAGLVVNLDDNAEFISKLDAPKIVYKNTFLNSNLPVPVNTPNISPVSSSNGIAGNYTGKKFNVISLGFNFPRSELSIDKDNNFSFDGDNFNLSSLSDPAFLVNGSYPLATIKVSGKIIPDRDLKTAQITVTGFKLDFVVNKEVVNNTIRLELIKSLESKGFRIPKTSLALPTYLSSEIVVNGNNLSLESNQNLSFIFSFQGTRQS